jgi:hypothetical protein
VSDHHGQCRCGDFQYRLAGEIKSVVNCHCNMCRSINGSAFSTYVVVSLDALDIVNGRDKLSKYQVTEGAIKNYCVNCGTPIFNINSIKYPGLAMVYLGTLMEPAPLTPAINIFSESKLPWIDSLIEIRSFAGEPRRNS